MQLISSNGREIPAYLAQPESGRGPGVLVLHAWWGLNDFFIDYCDRLARAGFVALAPDLYRGQVTARIAEAEVLMEALDGAAAIKDILAAAAYLRGHPAIAGSQIGVIGFSMGGYYAFTLATELQPEIIGAAVAYYGLAGGDYSQAHAAFLGHYAENDSYESLENVRGLEQYIRSKGKQVEFIVYAGAEHWFCESNRPDVYQAAAAQLAWDRTVAFLHQHLAEK